MKKVTPLCSFCGKLPENPKVCSRCKIKRYCDVECQKKHWTTHKEYCNHDQTQISDTKDQTQFMHNLPKEMKQILRKINDDGKVAVVKPSNMGYGIEITGIFNLEKLKKMNESKCIDTFDDILHLSNYYVCAIAIESNLRMISGVVDESVGWSEIKII